MDKLYNFAQTVSLVLATLLALLPIAYVFYLLLVAVHVAHPLLTLDQWTYDRGYTTFGKVAMALLVLGAFWPAAVVLSVVILCAMAASVSNASHRAAHGPFIQKQRSPATQTDFVADPEAIAAYTAAHDFSKDITAYPDDKQSIFLHGDSDTTALVQGMVRGHTFTWYRAEGRDVYAVRTGKSFPHVYIRSQLTTATTNRMETGRIAGTSPITLEGDFSKYFTVYAGIHDGQVNARELLTPDVMLTILQTLPRTELEFLNSSLYIQFTQTADSDTAAFAQVSALSSVVRQVLEQSLSGYAALAKHFLPRHSFDINHLWDKALDLMFKLIAFVPVALILAWATSYLPHIGNFMGAVFGVVIAGGLIAACLVTGLCILYTFAWYTTGVTMERLIQHLRTKLLVRSYYQHYPRNA